MVDFWVNMIWLVVGYVAISLIWRYVIDPRLPFKGTIWQIKTYSDNRTLGTFGSEKRAKNALRKINAIYGEDDYYISSSVVE